MCDFRMFEMVKSKARERGVECRSPFKLEAVGSTETEGTAIISDFELFNMNIRFHRSKNEFLNR